MEIIQDIWLNRGIDVLAFDYSQRMVELARKRQARFNDRIEFCVADVTKYEDMMSLKKQAFYKRLCPIWL